MFIQQTRRILGIIYCYGDPCIRLVNSLMIRIGIYSTSFKAAGRQTTEYEVF
jgi:hypothetical protein